MATDNPCIIALSDEDDNENRNNQRCKRHKKLLVQVFLDFAKNTTLHGLRYMTERGLNIVEKFFWFITFAASVSVCFYFIINTWYKWQTNPMIVSFGAQQVSVDEVPFPSVTICPNVKFLQQTFNYSNYHGLYEEDYYNDTSMLESVRTANAIRFVCDWNNKFNNGRTPNVNATVINKLHELLLDHDTIFLKCMWEGSFCIENIFKKVLTKDGICFNFNGLMAEDIFNEGAVQQEYKYTFATNEVKSWDMVDGYANISDKKAYPHKGNVNGGTPNLLLVLTNLEKKEDRMCNYLRTGYKIYLHHPADIPQSVLYHFSALPRQTTSLGIEFTKETAHPDLRKYPVEIRQCNFPEDRPLKFYKKYTYNNCVLECLTNYTYIFCGCVAFYMPYNDSTEICASSSMSCVSIAEVAFDDFGLAKKCQCLPACDSVQYDAEIHKSDFNLKVGNYGNMWKHPLMKELIRSGSDSLSQVEIFYKRPMFRTVHRSVLYGLTDFLSNCGGLLGLFLGFSWLSLVEIFYFLTFRVYKAIKADVPKEDIKNPNVAVHSVSASVSLEDLMPSQTKN